MKRIILHIDMNAFFASVEQQADPKLKGKPVIVGTGIGLRGVVSTSSYEARPYGIKSGMPLREAIKLCPYATFIPVDPYKYESVSKKIMDIFFKYTPLVEVFSIDEAYLDVTGSLRIYGSVDKLVTKIKEDIKQEFGVSCSAGMGPNKLLAKLASSMDKPDGFARIMEEDVPLLATKLLVSALCGIGPGLTKSLEKLNIITMKDLAECNEKILIERYGIIGRRLHLMSLGKDPSPVLPYFHYEDAKSMGHSITFGEDVSDFMKIKRTLLWLSERVGRRLRKAKMRGKKVTIGIRYGDFTSIGKGRSILQYINDGYEIYRSALEIMKSFIDPEREIRLVGVSVSRLVKGIYEPDLFEDFEKKERLLHATDKINDRFGEFTVKRAFLLGKVVRKILFNPLHPAR
ncbi:DNA polymerase IV [candidate division WOR-3 bacterium]|nr:DNA polymerase IV [candidate division WOR-3 bacterium]